jgi:hypothetical protein
LEIYFHEADGISRSRDGEGGWGDEGAEGCDGEGTESVEGWIHDGVFYVGSGWSQGKSDKELRHCGFVDLEGGAGNEAR